MRTVIDLCLAENWQFTYFFYFDRVVSKKLFDEVIINMDMLAELIMLASTCDQGVCYDSLWGKLGISQDQLSYQNPAYTNDQEYVVYFLHDYVEVENYCHLK